MNPTTPASVRSYEELEAALVRLPNVRAERNAPLAALTRFGIGGPAALLVETRDLEAFGDVLRATRKSGLTWMVIGDGTNLVVADQGFPGVVLRLRAERIRSDGPRVRAESGARLQALVDYAIDEGLAGLESMTGIPGWVGGAVYGNAGAYGQSIHERIERVCYHDGESVAWLENAECEFAYRESVFKRRKDWVILWAELRLERGPRKDLRERAESIRKIRDAKYPPSMRCAGSIFKNCFLANLPPAAAVRVPAHIVKEGKVPSAWFLEQVGAKGLRRGDIQVAAYHANLIYNDGQGTAVDLCAVVTDLKGRVRREFGFELEEEVQYVGFDQPDRG